MATNREQGFITELLLSGDMTTVVDNSINSSYLTGRYKKAFRFIQEHQSKYGKVPSIEIFTQKNGIELAEVDNKLGTGESLKFWCDELRVKKKHNTIADNLENISKLMNDDMDTDGAYEEIKKVVLKVENEIILSDRIKINEHTNKRKEDYKKRQKSGGMTGIPSYIEHWDKISGGYNNGELVTFMGYTGTGKLVLNIA